MVYVCKLGNVVAIFFSGEMLKLCGGLDFLMISGAIKVFSLKKYIVYQIVNIFMIDCTVSVIRIKTSHPFIDNYLFIIYVDTACICIWNQQFMVAK